MLTQPLSASFKCKKKRQLTRNELAAFNLVFNEKNIYKTDPIYSLYMHFIFFL